MHHYEQPEDESPPPASQPLRTAFHNKAPANHLDGGLLIMVGHTGIVWNQVWRWLMEVERLRLQVGRLSANALNGGDFPRL